MRDSILRICRSPKQTGGRGKAGAGKDADIPANSVKKRAQGAARKTKAEKAQHAAPGPTKRAKRPAKPVTGIPTVSLGTPPSQTPPPTQPQAPSTQQRRAAQQRSAQSSQQQPAQKQRSEQSSQRRRKAPVGEETEIIRRPKGDKPVEYRAQPDPSLAETQDMDPIEVERPPEISSKTPRVSFGQAAVDLKLVTGAQIQECVNIQRAMLAKGERVPLLGQLLLKRGHLDRDGVEQIKSHQQMYSISDKIDGYKLVEKLGAGAMGIVFKARQLRMDRWVAIKVLQPELAANAIVKQRFLQEARASARLNHPNVITGIDAGEIGGLCYFAMEYVEGKTLQQLVKERGALDERQALEIIIQVAKALEHAEKLSLVHRDVKPDNIMITRDRVAKLLDLGLAKMRAGEDIGATKGMAVGTPNYISPEQAMGREDIDTRSDIYSLGVTLFYVLTARVPYEGPPEVVMYRHIHEPPPHPKNFRPDLSDATCTLIHSMMAKRPEDRPASAGQLVSDMDHLIRTGKMPGLFDQDPAKVGKLKLNRDTDMLVGGRRGRGRAPRLKGYGMPPAGAKGNAGGAPGAGGEPEGPRLPRKRRKRW